MSDLRTNLLLELEKRGWNAYHLSEASGVPQPTIQRFLSGKHGEPRGTTVKKLAAGLGITEGQLRGLDSSISSLQHGDASAPSENQLQANRCKTVKSKRATTSDIQLIEIIAWENPEDLPDDQYAIVPRVRLKLSDGNGNLITEELPDAPLAFKTEWLKRKGVKRSNLVVVNAIGDSMEPAICCGALLLIDTGSTEIVDGRVYALRYGDELRVKRLYKRYDGGIIIRSDNRGKYPDETLAASDLNDRIYVIGRAIWQAGDL